MRPAEHDPVGKTALGMKEKPKNAKFRILEKIGRFYDSKRMWQFLIFPPFQGQFYLRDHVHQVTFS